MNSNLKSSQFVSVLLNKGYTYPFIALSAFLNYRIFGSVFGTNLQSKFILLWSILGLIVIVEYSLGINITNLAAKDSKDTFLKYQVLKSAWLVLITASISMLVLTGLCFGGQLEIFNLGGEPSLPLIALFTLICVFNAVTQIAVRYYSGIGQFNLIQNSQMISAMFSTLALFIFTKFGAGYYWAFAAACSNYLIQIPILLLGDFKRSLIVLLRNPLVRPKKTQKTTSVGYGLILLSVSIFSIFLNFGPRMLIFNDGSQIEVAKYSYFVIITTSMFSVLGSLGPVIWKGAIQGDFSEKSSLRESYKLIAYCLPPLLIGTVVLFSVLPSLLNSNESLNFESTFIILSFLFLAFQSMHLVGSNVLNSRDNLKAQARFMFLQSLAFSIFYLNSEDGMTALEVMRAQLSIYVILGFLPTLILLKKKKML